MASYFVYEVSSGRYWDTDYYGLFGRLERFTPCKITLNVYKGSNAETFAKKNNIPGFFSSMFISNTDEADFMGIEDVEEERIKESERKFVKTLNSLLRNNVPMEKWKEVFTSIIDTTNEVEVFNFTSLEYFE